VSAGPPLAVLIVDDEPLARMRLQALVEACPDPLCSLAGEAEDGPTALSWLREHSCDLVLADIQMPGFDGLTLADAMRTSRKPPALVYVTAHAEHALKAFELEAVDYLTKPVRRERLYAALARVAQRRDSAAAAPAPAGAADSAGAPSAGVLSVTDRGRVLRIPFGEVLCLKAELKYVTLVTAQRQWVLDETLAELEQRLGKGFVRVHRNALVSLRAVRTLERRANDEEGAEGWAVQLQNGDWLAVSRRQLTAVREALAGADKGSSAPG
jgi:two-component system, LytTR family, response regulator AlgR